MTGDKKRSKGSGRGRKATRLLEIESGHQKKSRNESPEGGEELPGGRREQWLYGGGQEKGPVSDREREEGCGTINWGECRMRAGRRKRMRRQYGGKLDGKGCRLAMKLMIDEEEPWGGAGSKTAMTTEEDEGHSRSSRPGMAVRSSRCFLQIIYIAIIHSKNNSGCSPAHRASLEVKSFLFLPPSGLLFSVSMMQSS